MRVGRETFMGDEKKRSVLKLQSGCEGGDCGNRLAWVEGVEGENEGVSEHA